MSFLNKQQMVDRISQDQKQNSVLIKQRQQTIKQLLNRISRYQNQITNKNKQIEQLDYLQKNVKKVPFNIYKGFLMTTHSDGKELNLVKKKSIDDMNINQSNSNKSQQYLIVKVKGQKPNIYLSLNTDFVDLAQIKVDLLEKLNQRESYEHIFEQNSMNNKRTLSKNSEQNIYGNHNIQKSKSSQLRQQQKKLLLFPPSQNANLISSPSLQKGKQQTKLNLSPEFRKKQSLPLNQQCNNLTLQLKKLKQKIKLYTNLLSKNHYLQLNNTNPESKKSITDNYIQQKINAIKRADQSFGIDLNNVKEQNKWKSQKQQYIEYIRGLQKELHGLRNYQFSFTDKGQMTNQKKTPSPNKSWVHPNSPQMKTPGLFQGTKYSQIREYNHRQNQDGNKKYNINKSQLSVDQNSSNYGGGYYKNQYHINTQRSRSKSKGSKSSKIIYLRR